MSSLHRFHPTLRISLLQGQGEITLEEWEQAAREILAVPAGGIRRILSDRRHMGEAYPAWIEERAMQFIRENAVALGDVQWAVVVAPESSAGKSVDTATQLNQGTRVRIRGFADVTAALRWLLGVYEEEDLVELVQWIEGTEVS